MFHFDIGNWKDGMDWDLAIEHNRTALLRLLAVLFASAGIVPGEGPVPAVRRGVYLAILFVLRPAEAATRRLVVIVKARMREAVKGGSPRCKQTAPSGPIPKGAGKRLPLFPLFDPRKQVPELARRKAGKGPAPRMFFFDGSDPEIEPEIENTRSPDDMIDAERLGRRMQALHLALGDLTAQAKRLARVQSRRQAAGESIKRTKPLRGGRPPGYRARWRHAVDEVLSDCHQLALWALAAPDSS